MQQWTILQRLKNPDLVKCISDHGLKNTGATCEHLYKPHNRDWILENYKDRILPSPSPTIFESYKKYPHPIVVKDDQLMNSNKKKTNRHS